MFSNIRERFGTAGLVLAIVAVIVALAGTAYAATKLNGTQKKEVEKIAKKFQGTGPAGTNGTNGAPGARGEKGENGSSVTGTEFPTTKEGHCTEGGVEFFAATGKTFACNGKKGTNGTTGFTSTLPGGKTETGAWTFGLLPSVPSHLWRVPISFNIPLAAGLVSSGCETLEAGPPSHISTTCHVHYINKEGKEVITPEPSVVANSTVCTGTAAAPTAPPGSLCVYETKIEEAKSAGSANIRATLSGEPEGTGTAGAMLRFREAPEESQGFGTWAVTAEE
jgi:hypothetical protein